jgi:hypothetical protein
MVDDRFIVISLSKPLRSRGNSWNPISRVLAPNPRSRLFAGIYRQSPSPQVLLAMQKVEGSNPFSRFVKAQNKPFAGIS